MKPLQHILLALAMGIPAACDGTASTSTFDASVDQGLADRTAMDALDAAAPADAPASEVVVDSGCPAPARLTPMQVPRGYLAPLTVRLIRGVDGDTAHFTYPVVGDVTVRFLYVNTEESHGAETTAWGIRSGEIVAGYLAAAREITLVLREDPQHPGMPDRDTYMRWLGLVFVDGELFQTRIVREGISAYFTEFGCAPEPLHTTLLNAEAEARANRRGIWTPGHPTNYADVFMRWFGTSRCRPNPFRNQPYCAP